MTNTVCFVDRNQQNTAETKTIIKSGFGGAAVHLGAMGWNDTFGNTIQTQHFVGALDGFVFGKERVMLCKLNAICVIC